MRRRRSWIVPTVVMLVAGLCAAPAALARPGPSLRGCAEANHPGGDWRWYSHDRSGTRHQPSEDRIGPGNARDLTVGWRLELPEHGVAGTLQNTPIIADGCAYLLTDQGWVVALNADSGDVLWTTRLDYAPAAYGGGAVGSPAVDRHRVYVTINRFEAPYVAALDRRSGEVLWTTVLDTGPGAYAYAQPLLLHNFVFTPFGGDQASSESSGGWTIKRASDGAVIAHHRLFDELDHAAGYAGASIWATPVLDPATRHAYVGTANPAPGGREHELANSIIKIDLDHRRPTFGRIVGHYKGTPDTYVEGLDEQPVCRNAPPTFYPANALPCAHLDLDFGASPNLFEVDGRLRVGELQKSGVYHVADAETMEGVWSTPIAPPCFPCNASTSAVADGRIFAVGTPPGQLVALDAAGGSPLWVYPVASGLHYQSVSVANGVVYTFDGNTIHGVDAATGIPVLRQLLTIDTTSVRPPRSFDHPAIAGALGISSSGIAIARNTLYVAAGNTLVALTLPSS